MTKLFAILIFMLSFFTLKTESIITISRHYCSNSSTFTPKSTYEANLNLLLYFLSSRAESGYGYFNMSEGKPSNDDAVYGSFLCRGDVTEDMCIECVTNAAVRIKEICPMAKVSILWFDECMLQYSDCNFFSATEKAPLLYEYDGENIKEPTELMKLLNKTMDQLIAPAAARPDKKYAYIEAYFKSRRITLYTFVQCRPDILAAHCEDCLQNATSNLLTIQTGKIGGRILLPSCFVRFETYPFYEIVSKGEKKRQSSSKLVIEITSATSAVMLLCVVLCFTLKRGKNKRNHVEKDPIGEGRFGPVYKGTLPCGRIFAAKRLSRSSQQGVQEFENEVELVAKLQQRNLVRLLGFVKEREETILVCEYMSNGSLDQLLFDPQQSRLLHWLACHKIMVGVVRGLHYLHDNSQPQIIHGDLKASNILLDDDMNPKISNFGMARICAAEQMQGSTNTIVGTYGHMSPEYATYRQFSVKSDVFSFGVLMLEIITGKKSWCSYISYRYAGLLDYVWQHWRTGALLQIVDPILNESYSTNEVIRCIHIGLLCVQNNKEARPTMERVVVMLSGADLVSLPMPKQPPFFIPSWIPSNNLKTNSNQSNEKLMVGR
ncbi:hypothetical protein BT93_C1714 [Corymbia citriodora subsp. variegata]|nr:hypothetical protein BT93_C1714 [Corymbia citriodora subsp. variegata]